MNLEISKGKILIALPTLLDPNFCRTVILLCDHGAEGSMGLVINRPTDVEVSALINDYPVLANAGRVYTGGPVSRNAMLILCRGNSSIEGHGVLKDVTLAKDIEIFKESHGWKWTGDLRCYLGYAGWAPGQLEAEMESGAWALMEGDSVLLFDREPDLLWHGLIEKVGGPWAVYASMPPDPSMN